MQIEKRLLIKSLDTVRRFISKESVSPIWSTVLIDGERQKIIAQNREGRAEIDLEIHDSYKQIDVPNEPEFPDEFFFGELMELHQVQLRNLCGDYGIPYRSNPTPIEMVREVWKASMIGADEEGTTKSMWIHEKFAINPIKLRKIVSSLDYRDDDLVDLHLEDYEANNVIDNEMQPYKIRIGENFSELPVFASNEFPSPVYFDSPLLLEKVAEFAGKELQHLCNASEDRSDLPFKEIILFDRDHDTVVSCDQKRVHTINKPMIGSEPIKIMTHIVRNLAREGKKVLMRFDELADVAVFETGNLSVFCEHVHQQFPKYRNKLNASFQHSVTTEAIMLEKIIKQSLILTGKHYRAVNLSFNDGQLSVKLKNPSAGNYVNENIDVTGGTVSPPESFKVDALWILHALFPKSGLTSWVDISFDCGGKTIKFDQGDCSSLVVTL